MDRICISSYHKARWEQVETFGGGLAFFVVDGWEKKHGTGRQSLRPCELDGGLSCYDKITFLALVCDVVVDNIYSRLISRIRF